MSYILLDRDERFSFLSAFRAFDLDHPFPVDQPFDAIFCAHRRSPAIPTLCARPTHHVDPRCSGDPPFANFELPKLRATIEALRPGASAEVPLFIAFNSRREAELVEAFSEQRLRRRRPLGYLSVKAKTQRHLFLYGPAADTEGEAK